VSEVWARPRYRACQSCRPEPNTNRLSECPYSSLRT
jgi:hypothetical protein